MMSSTDREILLDIQAEQLRQRQELTEIRAEVRELHEEQKLLHSKIDGLQTSVYWVLGAIAAIVAAAALPAAVSSFASLFRKSEPAANDSTSIINSLSEAFMKGLTLGQSEKHESR